LFASSMHGNLKSAGSLTSRLNNLQSWNYHAAKQEGLDTMHSNSLAQQV